MELVKINWELLRCKPLKLFRPKHQLVDKNPITDEQRGLHGRRWDLVGLHSELVDEKDD